MNRRMTLTGLALLAALVIAFLLRDVVEQVIIRPLAYLSWLAGVYYRYVPQPVLWLVLVVGLIYLAFNRLAGRIETLDTPRRKASSFQGPVDELAQRIERKNGGIYFKWQIARNLGQIAMEIQELRQHTRSRKLEFNEARANERVRFYLDAGLNTSFSDYPIPGVALRHPGKPKPISSTPFDGDIGAVIDYLESEMESNDDFRRS